MKLKNLSLAAILTLACSPLAFAQILEPVKHADKLASNSVLPSNEDIVKLALTNPQKAAELKKALNVLSQFSSISTVQESAPAQDEVKVSELSKAKAATANKDGEQGGEAELSAVGADESINSVAQQIEEESGEASGPERHRRTRVKAFERMGAAPDVLTIDVGQNSRFTVSSADGYGIPPVLASNHANYVDAFSRMAHMLEYIRIDDGFSDKSLETNIGTHWLGSEDAPVTVVMFLGLPSTKAQEFFNKTWPDFKHDYVDTGMVRFGIRQVVEEVKEGEVNYDCYMATIMELADDVTPSLYMDFLTAIANTQSKENRWAADGGKANLQEIATRFGIAKAKFNKIWNNNVTGDGNDVARRMVLQTMVDQAYYGFHAWPYFVAFKKNGDETTIHTLKNYTDKGLYQFMTKAFQ